MNLCAYVLPSCSGPPITLNKCLMPGLLLRILSLHDSHKLLTYCYWPTGAIALSSGLFPGELAPILTDVQCIGTESYLLDCPTSPSQQCDSQEEAAVVCQGNTLRLAWNRQSMSGDRE